MSALSVCESELNKALKVLRRHLKRALRQRASDQEHTAATGSALLLVVALKHIEAEGALAHLLTESGRSRKKVLGPAGTDRWISTGHGYEQNLALELHARLVEATPKAIGRALPVPSEEALSFAWQLLNNAAYESLWCDSSSIGFVHQVFCSIFREKALEKVQVANKQVTADTLIAFTQIYTPGWVTDFLLANALLPILESNPGPRQRYSQNGKSDRFRRWCLSESSCCQNKSQNKNKNKKKLEQIKLIDPACGAGNFLLAAYDLLKILYIEQGIPKERAVRQILEQQLFGADIDETALAVTCLALLTKQLIDAPSAAICLDNIASARYLPGSNEEELLGSISARWVQFPEHILSGKYDVVVTNPPYVGRRLISRQLKGLLSQEYPLSSSDLAAAFLEGSLKLLTDDGRLGVITQSSLLAIPSYRKFRAFIDCSFDTPIVVDYGSGVFPLLSGEKASSALIVIEKPASLDCGIPRTDQKLKLGTTDRDNEEVLQLASRIKGDKNWQGYPKRSQFPELLVRLDEAPQVQSIASVKQGLATTSNARFVRFSWDVDIADLGKTWVPYVKGAGSERWYAPNSYVVKWADNGREIKQAVADAYPYLKGKTAWVVKNEPCYFKPGLCFSFINKKRLSVRRLPEGCIFDVASSAIFAGAEQNDFLLGYLNSTLVSALAARLNPTINVQVGDVKKLPLPAFSGERLRRIGSLASECYIAKKMLISFLERPFCPSSHGDVTPLDKDWRQIWQFKEQTYARLCSRLSQLEEALDTEVVLAVAKSLALSASDLTELTKWLDQFKESLLVKSCFLSEGELFGKLIDDLAGRLVSAQANGDRVFLFPEARGDDAVAGGSISQKLLARAGIDRNIFADGIASCAKHVVHASERRMLDLAKAFRGYSRYLSLKLPLTGGILVISRRAVSNYLRLSAEDRTCHWMSNFRELSVLPHDGSVAEADKLLNEAAKRLSVTVDWTTKDLAAVLDDLLKV